MSKDKKCKHFTGYQNGTCKAGVNYRELVGGEELGWAARLCCIPDSPLCKEPQAKCDKYSTYSPAELVVQELERKDRHDDLMLAIRAIRERKDRSGKISCPRCDGGKIDYSVASNGHIWGRCETKDCLVWMM